MEPPVVNAPLICPGCKVSKTHTGLSRHLALTQDPRCIPFRTQFYGTNGLPNTFLPSADIPEIPSDDTRLSPDDHEPSPFHGDFFGDDYVNQDFPGWDDPNPDDALDQDLRAAPIDEDARPQWEPPQAPPPAPNNHIQDAQDPEPQPPEDHARHIQNTEETIREPRKRVKFTRGNAGAPIAESGQNIYQLRRDASDGNVWAPFQSKLDWEVAHWAKLRGPGSTAFTEFLKIDKVCMSDRCIFNCII